MRFRCDEPKAKLRRAFFMRQQPAFSRRMRDGKGRRGRHGLAEKFPQICHAAVRLEPGLDGNPKRIAVPTMSKVLARGVANILLTNTCTLYRLLYEFEVPAMAHVSYSELRNNLASYMEEVCDDRAPLVVTRQNARSVVIMSEEDYEGLMETVHLLKSPANAARLLRSIKDADRGKLKKREIVESSKAGSPRK
jgi:antitoxin YefM